MPKKTSAEQVIELESALTSLNITFRENEFAHDYEMQGLLGWGPTVGDPEIRALRNHLTHQCDVCPSIDMLWVTVMTLAEKSRYHPVRDYFNSLHWDGVARLDGWIHDYLKVTEEPEDYVRALSRLTLVGAVRRVMSPGCKNDNMLIFVGDQGVNKSTFLRSMMPNDDWFSDNLDLTNDTKDLITNTAGRIILESSELKGMNRVERQHLKSFVSRQEDIATLKYERRATKRKRQFVLFGSTNEDTFLQDITGDRRFPTVTVGVCDYKGFIAVRDQIWAEAVEAEKSYGDLWLPEGLWKVSANVAEGRRTIVPDELVLEGVLDGRDGYITVPDAWDLLDIPTERRYPGRQAEINNIVKKLGYMRSRQRIKGAREHIYYKGNWKTSLMPNEFPAVAKFREQLERAGRYAVVPDVLEVSSPVGTGLP
jgi:hypothetical protein